MNGSVLVVDDSLVIRQAVKRALAGTGFAVLEARDGVEALELLQGATDVRLVVCDVNMPRMDGLQLLERMRENPQPGPHVVMLTTEAETKLVERARQLGARGWLIKPVRPDLLAATARKLMDLPLGTVSVKPCAS